MTVIWVSTKDFTCGIAIENDIIVDAPPILRKFRGQSPEALKNWLKDKGIFDKWEEI